MDLGGRGGSGREDMGDIGKNMIKIYYIKFSKNKNVF